MFLAIYVCVGIAVFVIQVDFIVSKNAKSNDVRVWLEKFA
jgi:hypothetical protein